MDNNNEPTITIVQLLTIFAFLACFFIHEFASAYLHLCH